MKARNLLFILLIFIGITFSCKASLIDSKILTNYKKTWDKLNMFGETRIYEEEENDNMIMVNIIKKSNSDKYLFEQIINVIFQSKQNNYYLYAYVIRNFNNMTRSMYDNNKNLISNRKLNENYLTTEKIRNDVYQEECYFLPFLHKNYLRTLKKSNQINLYSCNSLMVKSGFSAKLIFHRPISVKILIDNDIAEFYQDQFGDKVYRFLEKLDNIDINNLDEVEKYAKAKVANIDNLKKEIE